ncbi:MAG: hypothetical protein QOH32_1155, partial [Bradyrhizobium sp.]|nr:hypothetical protein [Bradyrhizobium sp.]
GVFAGMALLKPVLVAGPTVTAAAPQAALAAAATVRKFLQANGVTGAGESPDPKTSVVRVICVRK